MASGGLHIEIDTSSLRRLERTLAAAAESLKPAPPAPLVERLATAALRVLIRAVCGIRGHQNVWKFGRAFVSLECTECGHVGKGWDLRRTAPPVLRYSGKPDQLKGKRA